MKEKENPINVLTDIIREYERMKEELNSCYKFQNKVGEALGMNHRVIPGAFLMLPTYQDMILAVLKEADINAFRLSDQIRERERKEKENK